MIAEALGAGLRVVEEFVAVDAQAVSASTVHVVEAETIERAVSTVAPQPNVAIFEIPTVADLSADGSAWVLVADRIQDPGNLGTMIRSAVAAGAAAVVSTPGSVDFWSPKVVRASAGALFHVSCHGDIDLSRVAEAGFKLIGTSSHDRSGVVAYDAFDFTGRVGLVMGNESVGLPSDAPMAAWVTVPHAGPVESLNVAMATTVVSFEIARQRNLRAPGERGK